MFHDVKPLTFFKSLKSLTYRLWDEQRGKLVGFRHARKIRKERKAAQAAQTAQQAEEKPRQTETKHR